MLRFQSTKELEVERFLTENMDKCFFRTEIIRLLNGSVNNSELSVIIGRLKDDNKVSITEKGIRWIGSSGLDPYENFDYSSSQKLKRNVF